MMNTAPCEWNITTIEEYIRVGAKGRRPDGTWQPARPHGYGGIPSRLRLAWDVFTGKADALYWPGQMPKAY